MVSSVNPSAPRATQPPLVAGRYDTAVRWPAISAPATLLAAFCASVFMMASDCSCFSQNAKKSRFLGANPDLGMTNGRSEEHTSELQSRLHLVCRLLLEKKKT